MPIKRGKKNNAAPSVVSAPLVKITPIATAALAMIANK